MILVRVQIDNLELNFHFKRHEFDAWVKTLCEIPPTKNNPSKNKKEKINLNFEISKNKGGEVERGGEVRSNTPDNKKSVLVRLTKKSARP